MSTRIPSEDRRRSADETNGSVSPVFVSGERTVGPRTSRGSASLHPPSSSSSDAPTTGEDNDPPEASNREEVIIEYDNACHDNDSEPTIVEFSFPKYSRSSAGKQKSSSNDGVLGKRVTSFAPKKRRRVASSNSETSSEAIALPKHSRIDTQNEISRHSPNSERPYHGPSQTSSTTQNSFSNEFPEESDYNESTSHLDHTMMNQYPTPPLSPQTPPLRLAPASHDGDEDGDGMEEVHNIKPKTKRAGTRGSNALTGTRSRSNDMMDPPSRPQPARLSNHHSHHHHRSDVGEKTTKHHTAKGSSPPPPCDGGKAHKSTTLTTKATTSKTSTKDTTTRRKRRKKDPAAPRRPLSAYNLFYRDVRLELKAEAKGASLSFENLVKEVSTRWRKILPELREKYEAEARNDNARYYAEMQQYRERVEVKHAIQSSEYKRRKILSVPKRPLSSYNIFFSEEHARLQAERKAEDGPMSASMATSEIKKRWAKLSPQEREVLRQRAEAERQLQYVDSRPPAEASVPGNFATAPNMPWPVSAGQWTAPFDGTDYSLPTFGLSSAKPQLPALARYSSTLPTTHSLPWPAAPNASSTSVGSSVWAPSLSGIPLQRPGWGYTSNRHNMYPSVSSFVTSPYHMARTSSSSSTGGVYPPMGYFADHSHASDRLGAVASRPSLMGPSSYMSHPPTSHYPQTQQYQLGFRDPMSSLRIPSHQGAGSARRSQQRPSSPSASV